MTRRLEWDDNPLGPCTSFSRAPPTLDRQLPARVALVRTRMHTSARTNRVTRNFIMANTGDRLRSAAHQVLQAARIATFALLLAGPPAAARAQAPTAEPFRGEQYAPFSDYFVHEVAFDEPVVELSPPSNASPAPRSEAPATEASLAERVQALEQYILELE